MLRVQKCRDQSTNSDGASQQTLNDVMLAAKLKEVELTCQLNECKEKLLITEQQVMITYCNLTLHSYRG